MYYNYRIQITDETYEPSTDKFLQNEYDACYFEGS